MEFCTTGVAIRFVKYTDFSNQYAIFEIGRVSNGELKALEKAYTPQLGQLPGDPTKGTIQKKMCTHFFYTVRLCLYVGYMSSCDRKDMIEKIMLEEINNSRVTISYTSGNIRPTLRSIVRNTTVFGDTWFTSYPVDWDAKEEEEKDTFKNKLEVLAHLFNDFPHATRCANINHKNTLQVLATKRNHIVFDIGRGRFITIVQQKHEPELLDLILTDTSLDQVWILNQASSLVGDGDTWFWTSGFPYIRGEDISSEIAALQVDIINFLTECKDRYQKLAVRIPGNHEDSPFADITKTSEVKEETKQEPDEPKKKEGPLESVNLQNVAIKIEKVIEIEGMISIRVIARIGRLNNIEMSKLEALYTDKRRSDWILRSFKETSSPSPSSPYWECLLGFYVTPKQLKEITIDSKDRVYQSARLTITSDACSRLHLYLADRHIECGYLPMSRWWIFTTEDSEKEEKMEAKKIGFPASAPKKWISMYNDLHEFFSTWCDGHGATLEESVSSVNFVNCPMGINFHIWMKTPAVDVDKVKFTLSYDDRFKTAEIRFFADNIRCLFNTPNGQFRIKEVKYCTAIFKSFIGDKPVENQILGTQTNGDPDNKVSREWKPVDVIREYFGKDFLDKIGEIFGKYVPKKEESKPTEIGKKKADIVFTILHEKYESYSPVYGDRMVLDETHNFVATCYDDENVILIRRKHDTNILARIDVDKIMNASQDNPLTVLTQYLCTPVKTFVHEIINHLRANRHVYWIRINGNPVSCDVPVLPDIKPATASIIVFEGKVTTFGDLHKRLKKDQAAAREQFRRDLKRAYDLGSNQQEETQTNTNNKQEFVLKWETDPEYQFFNELRTNIHKFFKEWFSADVSVTQTILSENKVGWEIRMPDNRNYRAELTHEILNFGVTSPPQDRLTFFKKKPNFCCQSETVSEYRILELCELDDEFGEHFHYEIDIIYAYIRMVMADLSRGEFNKITKDLKKLSEEYIWSLDDGILPSSSVKSKEEKEMTIKDIKEVRFCGRTTVIKWNDGTYTAVKRAEEDSDDRQKAIALCIIKRNMGNKKSYVRTLDKLVSRAAKAAATDAEKAAAKAKEKNSPVKWVEDKSGDFWTCQAEGCGLTNDAGAKFCIACGAAKPKMWKCGCGATNAHIAQYCAQCGKIRKDLEPVVEEPVETPKKPTTKKAATKKPTTKKR